MLAPRAQAKKIEIAAYVDERLPMQVVGDAARLRQVLLNLAGNAIKFTSTGGVALIVEPGIWPNEISFLVRDTGIGIAPEARERIFREFEQADDTHRAQLWRHRAWPEHQRPHRQAHGRPHHAGEHSRAPARPSKCRSRSPPPTATQTSFAAPDLSGQSIMLVSPQSIEASLTARRLQRWGGQTCMVSDADVARALLPERSWHAVLIDHALGAGRHRSGSAKPRALHATQRIVMFTPATRQELQPSAASAFTGYLVKPLRAASLAARLTAAPEVAAPSLAGEPPIEPPIDRRQPRRRRKGLSILVAEDNRDQRAVDALAAGPARPPRRHHHQRRRGAGILAVGEIRRQPYDLVLMDIQMPQLDGIETTKRIRSLEAGQPGRRTPILALTANTLVEDRYACFEAGMDGFLIKPLDREKLAEALAGLAASRHIAA